MRSGRHLPSNSERFYRPGIRLQDDDPAMRLFRGGNIGPELDLNGVGCWR